MRVLSGWNRFPDPSDAEKINVPLALFPSKSEDQDAVRSPYPPLPSLPDLWGGAEALEQVKGIYDGVEAKNPGKNVLKPYMDFNHGFAAARADVSDPSTMPNIWTMKLIMR
jgi:hypothetical protein